MLTAKDIRRKFLQYFEGNGHTVVSSSSLVPRDDPSLMFVNAGMVQFKKLFLGQEKRSYVRATTSQKCLRVSGKHNDLENVGRTARHHTFFEMLGNFSFGDYFKEEAIRLAWNFVTEELKLPKEKLYATVFREDDDAFELWQKITGLTPDRIFRMGEKDNFWSMGDTGPCGPCSEIYIDQGEDMSCGPDCGIGKCDCDRFLEIWNLVFMQYDQPAGGGPRTNLPRPSIDTGMGLERVAAVCQGKRSNYDSDLFQDIIQYVAGIAGVSYSFSDPDTNDVDTALRVISDHSRSAAFLIADGILPSNEGRGYVLRRLIRRALRFSTLMGMKESFMFKVVGKVAAVMGDDYPELTENADFLERVVREEEERFRLTLDKGLALLEDELAKLDAAGSKTISGEFAFLLYGTYGFPLDIITDVAEKRGFGVDQERYLALMKEEKDRARAARKGGEDGLTARFQALLDEGIQSVFTGYDCLCGEGRIVALLDADALPVPALHAGDHGFLVTGRTPFYGASGGQEGDSGQVEGPQGKADVVDTLKPMPALIVHKIVVREGDILEDQEVQLQVTEGTRVASARNHTATHLLHAALRKVLGTHVHQSGSLVAPDRLRFDFSHISAMTPQEIKAVEDEVNAMILADYPVRAEEMSREAATGLGAMALFDDKYGDSVRVVSVGLSDEEPRSLEFCGGTHLTRTGEAGSFAILSEAGVAAGVRRIEASTGWNTVHLLSSAREELAALAASLKARPGELLERVEALQKEVKSLRKDLDKAKVAQSAGGAGASGGGIMDNLADVNGVKLLAARAGNLNVKALRDLMDDVRSKLPSGVALLASEEAGEDGGPAKVSLILYVSKDLHSRFTAPDLIKKVAGAVGGSGGGRPDLAQAGGTNPAGIDEAFRLLREAVSAG